MLCVIYSSTENICIGFIPIDVYKPQCKLKHKVPYSRFHPRPLYVVLPRSSDAAQTKQLCDVMGRTISHRWPSPQLQSTWASWSRCSGRRAGWKTLLVTSTPCAQTKRLKTCTDWVHDVKVEKQNNDLGGKKMTRTSGPVLWNVRLCVSKKVLRPALYCRRTMLSPEPWCGRLSCWAARHPGSAARPTINAAMSSCLNGPGTRLGMKDTQWRTKAK